MDEYRFTAHDRNIFINTCNSKGCRAVIKISGIKIIQVFELVTTETEDALYDDEASAVFVSDFSVCL